MLTDIKSYCLHCSVQIYNGSIKCNICAERFHVETYLVEMMIQIQMMDVIWNFRVFYVKCFLSQLNILHTNCDLVRCLLIINFVFLTRQTHLQLSWLASSPLPQYSSRVSPGETSVKVCILFLYLCESGNGNCSFPETFVFGGWGSLSACRLVGQSPTRRQ